MSTDSIISICSNARLLCGQSKISALSEDTRGLCDALYNPTRLSVFRLGTWSRVRKRVQLPPLAGAPAFGWVYQFQLPPDFLRLVSIGETDESIEYEIENDKILSDQPIIKLRYVYDNEQPSTWDSLLVEAVTRALAAAFAYPLTASSTVQDAMQKMYVATLTAARGVNGQEAPVDRFGDHPILNSRLIGRGFPTA